MNYYLNEFRILRKNSRPWTEKDIRFVYNMRAEGMTCEAIGIELGRSKSAITGLLHRIRQVGSVSKLIAPKPAPTFADSRTCFACGARWGQCEHTAEEAE